MKIFSAHTPGRLQRLILAALAISSLLLALLPAGAALEPLRTAQNLSYATAWAEAQPDPAFSAFNDWVGRYLAASDANARQALIAEGQTLAAQRRVALAGLIASNPQRALALAMPASLRAQLPVALDGQLENRVSGIGDVTVLCYFPSRVNPVIRPLEWTVELNGVRYDAKAYGRRASQGSRKGIALHGIEVDGALALHEACLRELEPGETPNPSLPVVDLTGGVPATDVRLAELGGKIYRFATLAQLWTAERNLEANEAPLRPAPLRAPHVVLENPGEPPSDGGENPPTAWNTGGKNILVIRVDFSDLAGDPAYPPLGIVATAAYCQNLMDTEVSDYYARSSYGLTTLTNTVTTQLYRMPQTADFYATSGDNQQLHTDAQTLAAADYNLADYDRIVVVFSNLGNLPGSQITYGGLANIIGPQVWVNGEFDFRIMTHELGHTYGLFHSSLWVVLDGNPISPNGTSLEYGDIFDTMGANFADDRDCDFNPYFKNLLGWLRDDQVQTVNVDGIYRVHTFDWKNFVAAPTNATLALRFVKDAERTYWIGARRNFDTNPYSQNGAYVMWGLNTVGGGAGGGFQSALLDLNTPGAAPAAGLPDDYDAALGLGVTFVDPAVNFRVTPLANGGAPPNEFMDIVIGNPGPTVGLNLQLLTNYVSAGNGNGIVDTNECNVLDLVLTNAGAAEVTGIQATLTTTTPGVIVAQRAATYTNMPPGAVATNQPAFQFSVMPNFVCGTPINFALIIRADQGTLTNQFTRVTGIVGTPVRFDNFNVYPIPDDNLAGTNSPIVVSNFNSAVAKVRVALHIDHTFDADLRLFLISPDGITNALAINRGGSANNYGVGCQDNFRTIFDDAAGVPITAGFAPFLGAYQPEERLAVFTGRSGTNVNGTWQLRVVDEFAIDVGSIQCWSLYLSPSLCDDGGGQCPGVDLAVGMRASPNPVFIGSNLVYTISVTNHGPNIAKNVVMSQNLPNNVVFVNSSATQGVVSHSGGIVSASVGTLNPMASATVTVIVLPTVPGLASSTATVVTSDTDVNPSNNSVTIATQVNEPLTDLSVGIVGAPNPVLNGAPLAYTVSVTNGGPSLGTGVMVTNTLPDGAAFVSSFSSQGSVLNLGDRVVCTIGTMTNGGRATITINVIPVIEGTLTASARVTGNQIDPLPGNNLAVANVVVGPAADLSVGLIASPSTAVVNSNVTYFISVTNRGPSEATAVVLNDILPVGVALVSSNTTQGTFSLSGRSVLCSIGTLAPGAGAFVALVITPTNVGTILNTANVSGSQPDPQAANSSASASVFVGAPFVSIVPAGANLTSESVLPANGAIDPGEAVTIQLRLRNSGNVANTNLIATLLPTSGVVAPSGSQSYGVLAAGGLPVTRTFTFTAAGTNGGTVTATLQLQDGPNSLGTVSFNFLLPSVKVFANTNAIIIPDLGKASLYPSTIAVSGLTNLIGKVTATLVNMSHTYPRDVSVLLVGPGGQTVTLMSHAGAGGVLANGTLTFDSGAPSGLTDSGQLVSGSFLPTAYAPGVVLPPPAPEPPYGGSLTLFNGPNPNGTWSLFVMDESAGDAGSIAQGWQLAFTSVEPVNRVADVRVSSASSPTGILVGQNLTYSFVVTNNGPAVASAVSLTNQLPASLALVSATSSRGSVLLNGNNVVCSLGDLILGDSATVTVVATVVAPGGVNNTAGVYASETDLNPANNVVTIASNHRLPLADVALAVAAEPEPVVTGSNLTYTATVTNLGPETARNVTITVTNPFPAGFAFISGTNAQGNVVTNLGHLAPNTTATVAIVAASQLAGTFTNTITAATSSEDSVPANNVVTLITTVEIPSPKVAAAGALLESEAYIPENGVVEAGERVRVLLTLTNAGSANTTNLVAALQVSGGVLSPTAAQTYGALPPGGSPVSRTYSFTAAGTGGVVTATLTLQDGGQNLGTASFRFNLPEVTTYANAGVIVIPASGSSLPYPSSINVTGLTGLVNKVSVTVSNLNHSFPSDVNLLLAGPDGRGVVLMSHSGGGHPLTNLTVSFDDASAVLLPVGTRINPGTYKPTAYSPAIVFPPPAPGTHSFALETFSGTAPNGTWSLYVMDDSTGDGGSIVNGWSLKLTTVNPVNPAADLGVTLTAGPSPVFADSTVTYVIGVTNAGPAAASGVVISNTLPSGISFASGIASQGSVSFSGGVVLAHLGNVMSEGTATVTLQTVARLPGTNVVTTRVLGPFSDLNLANNTAQFAISVMAVVPSRLDELAVLTNGQFQATLIGQLGQPYVIQGSTNFSTWVPLLTNTPVGAGTFKFNDADAPNFNFRFYRAMRLTP